MRTSALNIVLHVISVQEPVVAAFLALEENHLCFFDQVSRLMQDAYSQILCRVSSRSTDRARERYERKREAIGSRFVGETRWRGVGVVGWCWLGLGDDAKAP